MAIRGRKPNPLRLVTGSHLKDRPLPEPRPIDPALGGPVEKPDKMPKPVARLWDRYIGRCHWLTWADSPKALMWCHLQAEYEKKPTEMIASRIAQLRALGSELGLDVSSRDRMGVSLTTGRAPQEKPNAAKEEPANPSKKYFD